MIACITALTRDFIWESFLICKHVTFDTLSNMIIVVSSALPKSAYS